MTIPKLFTNPELVTSIAKDTETKWLSEMFLVDLPFFHDNDNGPKNVFSITTSKNRIPGAETTSVYKQGRAVYLGPVLFQNVDGDRFLYVCVKGVGQTQQDELLQLKMAGGGTYAPAQSNSGDNNVYTIQAGSIRGMSDLNASIRDAEITEMLVNNGLISYAPIGVFSRTDQESSSILFKAANLGIELIDPCIFVRACKTPHRLDLITDFQEPAVIEQVFEQQKKSLNLLYPHLRTSTPQEVLMENLLHNLEVLIQQRVVFLNLSPNNVSLQGEILDFDDVSIYSDDFSRVLKENRDYTHRDEIQDMRYFFSNMIRILDLAIKVCHLTTDNSFRNIYIDRVFQLLTSTKLHPKQVQGLMLAAEDEELQRYVHNPALIEKILTKLKTS